MISTVRRGIGALLFAALATSANAQANEESTNRILSRTDWSVFVEDSPTQCWAVSSPKETVNTRDGRVVAVRRSDILLLVTSWPERGVQNEVSFIGGYPFASGSTVEVKIGDSSFEFLTQGENAWTKNKDDDARVVAAMKRGASAVVTGRSSRGTKTVDTFSLLGFTAAVEEAAKRCSG